MVLKIVFSRKVAYSFNQNRDLNVFDRSFGVGNENGLEKVTCQNKKRLKFNQKGVS